MTADRVRRAHRMAQSMLAQGVEQTLIASPYTIRYLTGCDVDAGERVNILLLHADGCMVWFVNALCAPKTCEDAALQIYRDGEDALALLAGMLRPGRVGVEHAMLSGFLLELMEKKPGLRPVNATPAIVRVRMIKDEEELALLRRSSAGNDRPQSTTTILSSYSKAVMFIPICSKPPRGIIFSLDALIFSFFLKT